LFAESFGSYRTTSIGTFGRSNPVPLQ